MSDTAATLKSTGLQAAWSSALGCGIAVVYYVHNDSVNLSELTLPALGLFATLYACLFARSWRAFVIPILFLAMPGPIEHVFPRVYFGALDEKGAAPIPLVSYLDFLVLTLAAIAAWERPVRSPGRVSVALLVGFNTIALASFLVNLAVTPSFNHLAGVAHLLMYVRFTAIVAVGRILLRDDDDLKRFMLGVAASAWLLLVDALYFTLIKESLDRLTAGSLGNNAFANILATIGFLIFGLLKGFPLSRLQRVWLWATEAAIAAMIIATKTRIAIVVFIIGLAMWNTALARRILNRRAIAAAIVAVALFFTVINDHKMFDRVNPVKILEQEEGIVENRYLNTFFLTRLSAWGASLQMIGRNAFVGIGPNQWNIQKYQYGFDVTEVMLDSHNGYLQVCAEYGVLGFALLYSVLGLALYCGWRAAWRAGAVVDPARWGVVVGFFVWMLSEITNAGIMKTRINAFVAVLAFILLSARRHGDDGARGTHEPAP